MVAEEPEHKARLEEEELEHMMAPDGGGGDDAPHLFPEPVTPELVDPLLHRNHCLRPRSVRPIHHHLRHLHHCLQSLR